MALDPIQLDNIQRYLLAPEDELERDGVMPQVRERVMRLRDIYFQWLKRPQMGDADIVGLIREQYGIRQSQAYEDCAVLKVCIGNLQHATRQWYQWLFVQRCEEGFRMARKKNDANSFAKVLSALGKYTRLDREELSMPDYSQIVPLQLEITTDPTVAGFERIPNLKERYNQLMKLYAADAVEVEDGEAGESGYSGEAGSSRETGYSGYSGKSGEAGSPGETNALPPPEPDISYH